MRVLALDIGSRTVKRVIVEDREIIEFKVLPNSYDPLSVCEHMLNGQRYHKVVATGYGRRLFAEYHKAETLTEIRAVSLGASYLYPGVRTLIDIGGQDTKVVKLNSKGSVVKFEMNDRCAAGTGRFLEVMATALSYPLADFIQASLSATDSISINAMCTVFAESEVISATARGVDRSKLARGLHEAVVRRAAAMLNRLHLEDDIVFCGGGALNKCLHQMISASIGHKIKVPAEPQIMAALGAALLAD